MLKRIPSFLSLTKYRIGLLVLVTTSFGYFLGSRALAVEPAYLFTLLGTLLCVGGAAVLNNFIERDSDTLMLRTRERALPAGLVTPAEALSFGITLVLAGITILTVEVNLLTAFLGLLSVFLYVVVYTPLKRMTWLNTMIGAIPGALPPLGGWAAATNSLSLEAWTLFAILFIWQHPHFYSIAWIYREDYRRAGMQMLPAIDLDGQRTFRQMIGFSLALIPVSLLPTFQGLSGNVYAVGALVAGLAMLWGGITMAQRANEFTARRLLRISLVYLPLLLVLIALDIR